MATEQKKTENGAEAFDAFKFGNPEFFTGGFEKMSERMTAFADFQKASYEAVVESASTFAKGVEKATSDQTAFVKESYEDGVAAAKAVTSSKSIQDAISVQNDYVRTAFEKNLKQFNKAADHWVALTKEISEPLTEQYGAFVEKVQAYRP